MRWASRALFSVAAGGMLLTSPASLKALQAQADAPAQSAPVQPAPEKNAPGLGEERKPAEGQPAPKKDAAPSPESAPAVPAAPAPAVPLAPTPAAPAPVVPVTPAPANPVLPIPGAVPGKPAQPARPTPAPAPSVAHPAPAVETSEEQQFVDLVNEERAKRGLSHLVVDPLLIKVARLHSAEMRDRNYFNHESPDTTQKTPLDRYLRQCSFRPSYACVGENLFYCSVVDVQRGHTAFMNSPTHRENVLFPRYEKIGVGIVKNEKGEFWVTQMYLSNTDPISVAQNPK